MEIRGIVSRSVRIALVRRHLNQVSRNEARCNAQVAKNLYQQPCRVATGSHALFKSLLACLDAWVKPRYVADFVAHPLIQVDQKASCSAVVGGNVLKKSTE